MRRADRMGGMDVYTLLGKAFFKKLQLSFIHKCKNFSFVVKLKMKSRITF